MSETTKRKTKAEQIEGIEQQLEQLQNRKKLLIKQHKEDERKARNRRLYQLRLQISRYRSLKIV